MKAHGYGTLDAHTPDAQKEARRRLSEARESRWHVWNGGWQREYGGHQLRVECEGAGYRLFVNGHRRGYFDTTQKARSAAIWIVDRGLLEPGSAAEGDR